LINFAVSGIIINNLHPISNYINNKNNGKKNPREKKRNGRKWKGRGEGGWRRREEGQQH